jgi:hypothetical protein
VGAAGPAAVVSAIDQEGARASVASPLPLTDQQADVVLSARAEPVTVVSGPPGTGKSQTAAAIALDAVAHGRSVLVATQSAAAADVLAELLDRVPGPTPVLFGGGERASRLAAKLADGLEASPDDRAGPARDRAEKRAAELGAAISADLHDAAAAAACQDRSLTLPGHALVAPRLLDVDATVSVSDATDLLARAQPGGGWWSRRRADRAGRKLRILVGAPPEATVEAVADAVELAQVRDRARRTRRTRPEDRAARWQALEVAERERRLARARAVVIGDPRQLRFVSFLADAAVQKAVAAHGLGDLGDRLDLRRVSAFDLAAGAATVTFLDEHYRSVPHLIGFSARHFYDGRLLVATRHPANECGDAIDVHQVSGTGGDGANRAEGDATVALVELFLADPANDGQTIGVISPNRNQVDWLRDEIGRRVSVEVLQAGRIRLATVHGFQGAEADAVVASFVVSDSNGRSRRFLEDPNLFNVLVTRARRRLVVVTSLTDPPPGLVADYLRWADHGPAPEPEGASSGAWTDRLAAVLRDAGTTVRVGYPVGRWTIDLVVGDGDAAVALATTVHPDGAGAHVRRHLALARSGWRQADAFASDHEGDAVAAALALRSAVALRPTSADPDGAIVDSSDEGARR